MQPELLGPAHDGSGVVSDADQVPLIERLGNDLAVTRQELEAQKKILANLLEQVGMPAQCRGCRAAILWVHHAATTGTSAPYNLDGTNHFGTCPNAARFRRRTNAADTTTGGRERSDR